MSLLISKTDILDFKQFTENVPDNRINPYITESQEFDLKAALGYPLFFELMTYYKRISIVFNTLVGTPYVVGETISGKLSATVVATGTVISNASGVLVLDIVSGSFDTATTLLGGTGAATANVVSMTYGKYYKLLHGETYTDAQDYSITFKGIRAALVYWAYARFVENQNMTVTATGLNQKENEFSKGVDSKMIAARISQARSGALAFFEDVKKYLCDMNTEDATNFPLWRTGTEDRGISGGSRYTTVNAFRSNGTSTTKNY